MKAKIDKVTPLGPFEGKYGTLYGYKVQYGDRTAFYNSKSENQTKFVEGQQAEFEEIPMTGKKGPYIKIKPSNPNAPRSRFGKRAQVEQARYSGFAVSYAKDLAVAGLIPVEEIRELSTVLFEHMVNLDKTLQQ